MRQRLLRLGGSIKQKEKKKWSLESEPTGSEGLNQEAGLGYTRDSGCSDGLKSWLEQQSTRCIRPLDQTARCQDAS